MKNQTLLTISRTLSYIMHPMLLPLYMAVLILTLGAMPVAITGRGVWYVLRVIVADTVIVPVVSIALLRWTGRIPDFSLSSRRSRVIPLAVVVICYGCCGWIFAELPSLFILRKALFAAAAATAVDFVVNFFWQISLHLTGWGAAIAVIWVLVYAGYSQLVVPLAAMVLLSGFLASARLYMGKHTPLQVAVGFAVGFAVALTVFLLA